MLRGPVSTSTAWIRATVPRKPRVDPSQPRASGWEHFHLRSSGVARKFARKAIRDPLAISAFYEGWSKLWVAARQGEGSRRDRVREVRAPERGRDRVLPALRHVPGLRGQDAGGAAR